MYKSCGAEAGAVSLTRGSGLKTTQIRTVALQHKQEYVQKLLLRSRSYNFLGKI